MSIQQVARTVTPQPSAVALLDDRIVDIVNENAGIRETELFVHLLSHIEEDTDGSVSPEFVFTRIYSMIQRGRIVGVDCETGDTEFTLLLPVGSTVRITVPVTDRRTRH